MIFVAVNPDRLRPLLRLVSPATMPDAFALLVRLVRMHVQGTVGNLGTAISRSRVSRADIERCAEIARSVITDYERMQRDAQNQGIEGIEQVLRGLLSRLPSHIKAYGEEWMRLMKALMAPVESSADLSSRLKDLLDNNAKWIEIAAKQFSITAADLR